MTGAAALPPIEIESPYCVACGCTEFSPCETPSGPCGWTVQPGGGRGLCSRCAPHYSHPGAVVKAVKDALASPGPKVRK
jgi:hypothetical protein